MLAGFLMLGRWLEARAKGDRNSHKKIMGLQAKTATVILNEEVEVPVEEVSSGIWCW